MANVIMMENNGKYAFKLPANLASGEYLVCIYYANLCEHFLIRVHSYDQKCWRFMELMLSAVVNSISGKNLSLERMDSYSRPTNHPDVCSSRLQDQVVIAHLNSVSLASTM